MLVFFYGDENTDGLKLFGNMAKTFTKCNTLITKNVESFERWKVLGILDLLFFIAQSHISSDPRFFAMIKKIFVNL